MCVLVIETVGKKSSFGRPLKNISNLRRLFSVSRILWRLGFPGIYIYIYVYRYITPSETNIAAENQWLEDVFPFRMANFPRRTVRFREGISTWFLTKFSVRTVKKCSITLNCLGSQKTLGFLQGTLGKEPNVFHKRKKW